MAQIIGPFQLVPLGGLKWRFHFENSLSTKLYTSKSLLWQVRSRRRVSPAKAQLLLDTLTSEHRYPMSSLLNRTVGVGHPVWCLLCSPSPLFARGSRIFSANYSL